MILLLIPLVLSVLFILIWGWVKLVNFFFNPAIRKLEEKHKDLKDPYRNNLYVNYHRQRDHNDKLYDDYLKWMQKNGHGLPADKFKFPEEQQFERDMGADQPADKNRKNT